MRQNQRILYLFICNKYQNVPKFFDIQYKFYLLTIFVQILAHQWDNLYLFSLLQQIKYLKCKAMSYSRKTWTPPTTTEASVKNTRSLSQRSYQVRTAPSSWIHAMETRIKRRVTKAVIVNQTVMPSSKHQDLHQKYLVI